MEFGVSDELLGTFAPILVYWVYSGIYILLGSFENYRLHSKKEEDDKNLVSKWTVVKGVLLQQFVQAVVAILLFTVPNLYCCILKIFVFHVISSLLPYYIACFSVWME
ncbi:hypothetical protein CsSME_00021995 [Camellia sinensis var. sinensis]